MNMNTVMATAKAKAAPTKRAWGDYEMPIYEYECNRCKKVSEILVFSSVRPECPECGSKDLKKLMSATSSLTGRADTSMHSHRDKACCGSRPGMAPGCKGPGSCCGKI